ncbi:MAG TPA: STN domain-containing protein [Methylovirgula sp.]|nr:STN domain-containing protein [Methylovirgula sp.]
MFRISGGRARVFALAVGLTAIGAANGHLLAAEGGNGIEKAGPIAFDIEAQPLASALDAYSAKTGREVLYDSSLTARRRSTEVKGKYTIEDALTVLLAGSGLQARKISPEAITIMPMPIVQAAPGPRPGDSPYRAYFAMIQASFEKSLCQSTDAVLKNRTVIKFEIGASGRIEHAELLDSTGDADRDSVVKHLLEHMSVGQAPPADLPQPIMLLVLPQPRDVRHCPSAQ